MCNDSSKVASAIFTVARIQREIQQYRGQLTRCSFFCVYEAYDLIKLTDSEVRRYDLRDFLNKYPQHFTHNQEFHSLWLNICDWDGCFSFATFQSWFPAQGNYSKSSDCSQLGAALATLFDRMAQCYKDMKETVRTYFQDLKRTKISSTFQMVDGNCDHIICRNDLEVFLVNHNIHANWDVSEMVLSLFRVPIDEGISFKKWTTIFHPPTSFQSPARSSYLNSPLTARKCSTSSQNDINGGGARTVSTTNAGTISSSSKSNNNNKNDSNHNNSIANDNSHHISSSGGRQQHSHRTTPTTAHRSPALRGQCGNKILPHQHSAPELRRTTSSSCYILANYGGNPELIPTRSRWSDDDVSTPRNSRRSPSDHSTPKHAKSSRLFSNFKLSRRSSSKTLGTPVFSNGDCTSDRQGCSSNELLRDGSTRSRDLSSCPTGCTDSGDPTSNSSPSGRLSDSLIFQHSQIASVFSQSGFKNMNASQRSVLSSRSNASARSRRQDKYSHRYHQHRKRGFSHSYFPTTTTTTKTTNKFNNNKHKNNNNKHKNNNNQQQKKQQILHNINKNDHQQQKSFCNNVFQNIFSTSKFNNSVRSSIFTEEEKAMDMGADEFSDPPQVAAVVSELSDEKGEPIMVEFSSNANTNNNHQQHNFGVHQQQCGDYPLFCNSSLACSSSQQHQSTDDKYTAPLLVSKNYKSKSFYKIQFTPPTLPTQNEFLEEKLQEDVLMLGSKKATPINRSGEKLLKLSDLESPESKNNLSYSFCDSSKYDVRMFSPQCSQTNFL